MVQETSSIVSIKSLLEAGAHFGHQRSRWHPKMKKYIFTQRNGIHIIDLQQTVVLLEKAMKFVRETVADGGTILFVGTKKQAQEAVENEAKRAGMPFVNQRWIGGMLTNFTTIQARIDHLVMVEDQLNRGQFRGLPKKEIKKLTEQVAKLNKQMSGFKEMTKLPTVLFVVDPVHEKIAVAEAKRMDIPVVSMVDTNCNPELIDLAIPSNDDAIRSVRLICSRMADAAIEGKTLQLPSAADKETEEAAAAGEAVPQTLSFAPEPEVKPVVAEAPQTEVKPAEAPRAEAPQS